MARLDVSELMTDPDFIHSFTWVKRTAATNNFGENVVEETEEAATGSVQAATGETAERFPEGIALNNFKTIYTKARVSALYPDQIIWKGKRFNVRLVTPWEDFGAGWFMVDVEMENKK